MQAKLASNRRTMHMLLKPHQGRRKNNCQTNSQRQHERTEPQTEKRQKFTWRRWGKTILFCMLARQLQPTEQHRRIKDKKGKKHFNLLQKRVDQRPEGGGDCTCVKMEPFVLLASFPLFYSIYWSNLADLTTENGTMSFRYFPCLIVFFASKLDISPLKHSVFGVSKRAFWGSTRTNGEFGFQKPKTAEMPIKQGKSSKITLGLITGIGLKLAKNDCKTGEKHQKDKWLHFHAPTCTCTLQNIFRKRGPKNGPILGTTSYDTRSTTQS